MAIRIVVDSAADYSVAEIEKRKIDLACMTVSFEDEVYKDGLELTKDEFFEKLIGSEIFPKTSQPSPNNFIEIFEKAKEAGDQVIAILVSGALSGTVQNAFMSKSMLEYDDIYIVDSITATLGIRLLVDTAVRMRDQGKTAQEIVEVLENLKSRVRIYAGLDTLEYLYKGGRLSKTEATIGKIANIKPVVTITKEGLVAVVGKQMGMRNAFKYITKLLDEKKPDMNYPVYYLYSYDKNNVAGFVKTLQKKGKDFGEVKTRGIGPTIGTHIGPGAFGIVYIEAEN